MAYVLYFLVNTESCASTIYVCDWHRWLLLKKKKRKSEYFLLEGARSSEGRF